MADVMKRVEDNSYLERRGRVWWYNRRVPTKCAHLYTRRRIKESLGTTSVEQARYKRDLLAEADDHYWASLQIAEEAGPATNREVSEAISRRYRMATVNALACGFTYKPIDHLATEASLEETLARLLAVRTQAGPAEIPRERDAEALLGGATKPTISVSEAFEVYLSEIAYNAQLYKSPNQRASWEKTKRTSIQYFIDFAGDIALDEITRELALKYQQHWARQVKPKDGKVSPVAPNTANRHIGNIRSLYGDYFKHVGEEERPNPFRNMHFKAKARSATLLKRMGPDEGARAFAHYYDKGELFSANMMKNFRNRGLLESPDHKIYSFRHAFEKRMQEANIDYGLRCLLMGHKTTRPVYGDGGSLSYRKDELLKIAHPFDARVMGQFERENPEWALGGDLDGS